MKEASALIESRRLIEFVVWELRKQDLPPDVQAAAEAVAPFYPRPFKARGITEGPLKIDGFPADESAIVRRKAFPHQAGHVVRSMLDRGCRYVLVQDL